MKISHGTDIVRAFGKTHFRGLHHFKSVKDKIKIRCLQVLNYA